MVDHVVVVDRDVGLGGGDRVVAEDLDHQERREQIAAALMRVATNEGLEAVSLRHVAAEAGVTSGMVQHYFPSKEAMMDFAMQSASARFEARMTEAVAALGEDPSVRALLRTMLVTLLPLDESQRADGRVALAFLARAATRPDAAKHVGDDTDILEASSPTCFVTHKPRALRARPSTPFP